MSMVKDSLLLAAGGAIGLIAGVMLCDKLQTEPEDKESPKDFEEKFGDLVDEILREASAAMEQCQSDEERTAVYVSVRESVQRIQTALSERCDLAVGQLKSQAEMSAQVEKDVSVARANHLQATLARMTKELDNMLATLMPTCAVIKP